MNKSKEAEGMGFASEQEFAVYKTLEQTFEDTEDAKGQNWPDI